MQRASVTEGACPPQLVLGPHAGFGSVPACGDRARSATPTLRLANRMGVARCSRGCRCASDLLLGAAPPTHEPKATRLGPSPA
mmetsp:Transcript_92022/g.126895  ORF Transcript_92022/g.126895 Transcript_92022/m.126895 type:complete len:83 (+) Transcript_92022:354-602(+)